MIGASDAPWFWRVLNEGRADASGATSSPSITVSYGSGASAWAMAGYLTLTSCVVPRSKMDSAIRLYSQRSVTAQLQLVCWVAPSGNVRAANRSTGSWNVALIFSPATIVV